MGLTQTRVRDARPAGEGQVRLLIEAPAGYLDHHVRPGQYCTLAVPGGESAPYALASTPEERELVFLVRDQGSPGQDIARLGRGDAVLVSAPEGAGFDLEACRGRDVVLVATGTGIAPIRAALEALLGEGDSVGALSLYYGARSPRHVALGADLERFRDAGVLVHLHYSESAPGYVQDAVVATTLDPSRTAYVVAGHEEVAAALRAAAGSAAPVVENF